MPRGLDHIVHAVRDLDAAAALYRRLGFTVGARNRHPPAWGTQNHIVQFPGCFVELLSMADTSQIAPHGPRHFSFGAHNRDFLTRGEGLSMLVLEGRDTDAEAEAFRAAGVGDFEPFHFERTAAQPDGSKVKVAFSLAFARDARAPDIGFFTCRQHHPENFWNPAFQVHPNGATSIAGVVLVAGNPGDHRNLLSAFTGEREPHATSSGIAVKTPRGEIRVMTPAAYRDYFGAAPPDTGVGARLAALCFAMREGMGRPTVGPNAAMGAAIAFEPIAR